MTMMESVPAHRGLARARRTDELDTLQLTWLEHNDLTLARLAGDSQSGRASAARSRLCRSAHASNELIHYAAVVVRVRHSRCRVSSHGALTVWPTQGPLQSCCAADAHRSGPALRTAASKRVGGGCLLYAIRFYAQFCQPPARPTEAAQSCCERIESSKRVGWTAMDQSISISPGMSAVIPPSCGGKLYG